MTLEGQSKTTVEAVIGTIFDKTEVPTQEGSPAGTYTKTWQAVGCEKCNKTGYKGRIGIYEGILVGDPAVEKVIEISSSEREIAIAAAPQGILNMQQDGMIKVVQGMTSIEELRRVIDID